MPPRSVKPRARRDDVVAGRRPVSELLRAGRRPVSRVLVAHGSAPPPEIVELAAGASVPIEAVDRARLATIAGIEVHQGVVAETVPLEPAVLRDVLRNEPSLVIALDNVSDPRNLGAVLRVADASGADAVLAVSRNRAPLSPAAQKAAAGAAEWVPLVVVPNLSAAIAEMKDVGMWAVGLDASGSSFQSCALLDERVILVAGSEGRGLRPRVRGVCDDLCAIEMRGRVGSLNVASAVAIIATDVAARHGEHRKV